MVAFFVTQSRTPGAAFCARIAIVVEYLSPSTMVQHSVDITDSVLCSSDARRPCALEESGQTHYVAGPDVRGDGISGILRDFDPLPAGAVIMESSDAGLTTRSEQYIRVSK